ncbi:hypothetical protein KFK09_025010 [Dendrobium nobile]|uniref:Uncharacterized protein n=1 Tax=Dendrobium nobile TaxID=94219 RepID=A0A8T3AFN6_DENNO|nr:hypothetical protein KFK09_025010 [Dendrobium nobile]
MINKLHFSGLISTPRGHEPKMTKIPLWGLNGHFKSNDLQIEFNHLQQVPNVQLNPLNPFPAPEPNWLTKSTSFGLKAHKGPIKPF